MSISPLNLDLAALPKISLHDHLDGGLRPATMIELAEKMDYQLPSHDVSELAEWFFQAANSGSLEKYLETFDHTLAVMQTAENLERIAKEFVTDLVEDGVIYAEVRWAPEQHLREGLTLDETVEAVQRGFDAGAAEYDHMIQVNQILCAMRHADNAQEIAELAVRHRDQGVVGFDIAGAEAGFPAERFKETFTWLAEQNMPITVHAGEAAGTASIHDAIVNGRTLRLGHGVRLEEDIVLSMDGEDVVADLSNLAETVHLRQMVLELCPTSNIQTGAVEPGENHLLENHPFGLLYDLGFAVTVNPDNRLISGVSITDELYQLSELYDYDLDDLLQFQLNAAQATFQSAGERTQLVADLIAIWDGLLESIAEDGEDSPAILVELEEDEE